MHICAPTVTCTDVLCTSSGRGVTKGSKQCQKYGSIQRIHVVELHSIVKQWPFRGWVMDLIGKIYPTSSKGHNFIVVATNCFTKWVEVVPLKKVEQKDVI